VALLTSHVLDAVHGRSAADIRVEVYRVDGNQRTRVVCGRCDHEGRLSQEIAVTGVRQQFEMVVYAAEYFGVETAADGEFDGQQVMPEIVVRFNLGSGRQHIPVVLSPHACTIWWSQPR